MKCENTLRYLEFNSINENCLQAIMNQQTNSKEVEKEEALYITTEGSLPVHKPMTKGEIKAFYSISYTTLKKWLRPILDKIDYSHKRVFLTKDLRIIRELMDGIPLNAPSNREEI